MNSIYFCFSGFSVLKRFQGSKVYISETGDCDGNLVYTQTADPTKPWQDIFDIPVKADGTYVVICSKPEYMLLCEIQVIGKYKLIFLNIKH